MNVPYVGPIKVTFGNRFCYVGALVLGDEVLLGAVPMEDMDLVVNPRTQGDNGRPRKPEYPTCASQITVCAMWLDVSAGNFILK